jgi:hypothetical protein
MVTVVRTNDIVLISVLESILGQAGLSVFVADAHVSAVEGSIGAFPRRVMVPDDEVAQARRLIRDAGLEAELVPWSPRPGHG